MALKEQKFFFEAAVIRFGREHCRSITTIADTAGSLDGLYFDLNGQDPTFENEQSFVLAINSDPAVAGKTAIIATVGSGDSAAQVATAIKAAIDAHSGNEFRAIIDSNNPEKVIIENRFGGAITAETDSGSTGFTFAVETIGAGGALGKTADGVELTASTEAGDALTNQTGAIVNAQIYQGASAELSANFVELDEAKLRSLFSVVGDELQNSDNSYTVGFGQSKLFQDLSIVGGQLVVHPQRLALSDYSRDLVFWTSAPKPESLNFDGTSLQQMATTFTAYLDERYNTKVNLFALGNWTEKATVEA